MVVGAWYFKGIESFLDIFLKFTNVQLTLYRQKTFNVVLIVQEVSLTVALNCGCYHN